MSVLGEEVVTLIINDDECREVLDIYLAHSLHAKLLEVDNLNALDRVLREDGCRTTDRAEVEAIAEAQP